MSSCLVSIDADDKLETDDPLLKVSAECWGDLSGNFKLAKKQTEKPTLSD